MSYQKPCSFADAAEFAGELFLLIRDSGYFDDGSISLRLLNQIDWNCFWLIGFNWLYLILLLIYVFILFIYALFYVDNLRLLLQEDKVYVNYKKTN